MAFADTAFSRMTERCMAVFGETVARHNGAPEFLAERLRRDDVFGEMAATGELSIAFAPQAAPVLRGEQITLRETAYIVAETPREHEAGLLHARLRRA